MEFPPDWQQSALDTFSLSDYFPPLGEFGTRDLRHPDRVGSVAALKPARPNARHRLQAREAESAISGIVRGIISLMLVIVALPVI